MYLSNRLYDLLKWISLIALPATAVFIQSLGELFSWPPANLCGRIICLFAVFLGSLIQVSSQNYMKGVDSHA